MIILTHIFITFCPSHISYSLNSIVHHHAHYFSAQYFRRSLYFAFHAVYDVLICSKHVFVDLRNIGTGPTDVSEPQPHPDSGRTSAPTFLSAYYELDTMSNSDLIAILLVTSTNRGDSNLVFRYPPVPAPSPRYSRPHPRGIRTSTANTQQGTSPVFKPCSFNLYMFDRFRGEHQRVLG